MNGKSPQNLRSKIELRVARIDPSETANVALRDLVFLHLLLEEANSFFHQPMNYPDHQAVQDFLGTRDSGGFYDVLSEGYYHRMRSMLPAKLNEMIDNGDFDA